MKRRVTREEIIRTTRDLIIRNGIRAVRVDEIAQKLEISKRTLYELFSDKDTLVEQCWDKIREEQEKRSQATSFINPVRPRTGPESDSRIHCRCMYDQLHFASGVATEGFLCRFLRKKSVVSGWTQFTEVLEHCVADGSVLPDVDCQLFAKRLMNVLLGLYLEGGTRREMDAFGWALLRGIATHRGIEWLDGKKPNS